MSSYKDKILLAMNNKHLIRNICIVSHVDHGKTTLSDHLLQAGGLLSRTMAGTARALDYLDEEQKRGITIKTANISFCYYYNSSDYLINLVDSPGHVDFSGMVSQALRLVDGVIIVIDAVEGVMAQTESVIKQAMNEGLKPILFINKIDRLITELRLKKAEIEKKINTLVQLVNDLITQYSYEEWKNDWKVSFDKGTLILGSALYGWAISKYSQLPLKFDDIFEYHYNDRISELKEKCPIIHSILIAIIQNHPHPHESQKARIGHIVDIIDENSTKDISDCNDNKEVIATVGKLLFENNKGVIAVVRVFSGTLKQGQMILNCRTENKIRIHQLAVYRGPSLIQVDSVKAGNIAAIIGFKDIRIGDTLTENKTKQQITFKQIHYLQEPVLSRRVEPVKIADIPKLEKILEIYSLVKPNFSYIMDENTGEIKIYGIGQLQLDIIINELKSEDIQLYVSEPEVALTEQIELPVVNIYRDKFNFIEINLRCEKISNEKTTNYFYKDSRNNIFVIEDSESKQKISEMLLVGFKNAMLKGPVVGYPIRNVKIIIKTIKEIEPQSLRYEIVVPAVKQAIHHALFDAKIAVSEPFYIFEITTPLTYLGQILNLAEKYNCDIENIEHLSSRSIVKGEISVESSLKIANELRSASEGYAFWQFQFQGYRKRKQKNNENTS